MTSNYLILRLDDLRNSLPTRGVDTFNTAASRNDTAFTVQTLALTEGKAIDMMGNNSRLIVAPVMPLKLISPVGDKSGSSIACDGIPWGINAIKGDLSKYAGRGLNVAVLDTGIHKDHPAFTHLSTVIEKDFTGEGNGDKHGHGTHCAGTFFGGEVNGCRIGVAPGVEKVLIGKVLDSHGNGDSNKIVDAIQWAISNQANIISLSLGIDFPGYVAKLQRDGMPTEMAVSRALTGYRQNVKLFERLIEFVKQKSAIIGDTTIIVAATGNESRKDISPDYKIVASPPAISDGIISVAAVQQSKEQYSSASFSNTFPVLSAPGVDILSADLNGGLTLMSGTSMATPHVAGVAALWAEKLRIHQRLNAAQLTAQLLANCVQEPLIDYNNEEYGAGLVQAP